MQNHLTHWLYGIAGCMLILLSIFLFKQLFSTAFYFEPLDGFPGFYFLCAEVKWYYLPFLQLLISVGIYSIIIQLLPLAKQLPLRKQNLWKIITIITLVLWLLASIFFHISAPITRNMFPYNFIQSCDGIGFKSAFIDHHIVGFYTVSFAIFIPIIGLICYTISRKNATNLLSN